MKNIIERIVIVNNVSDILPEHFPGEILSKVQSSGEKRQDQRLYTIDMPDEGTDLHQTVMECTQDIQCH